MVDQVTDQSRHVLATTTSISAQKEKEEASSRKRHATDAHILEAKISKEAERIIKHKVAQDSANWELREKVKELVSTSERQQQNLVQLQMEYETLDGNYQNELRKREDTTNRVINTRSICNVLEEHFGRLTETLSRCQADRKTLYDSYQKVCTVIKDVRLKMATSEEQSQTTIENLKEQLATKNDHNTEMAKNWAENKSSLEQLNNELKKTLEILQANCNTLQNDNRQKNGDIDDRDKIIQTLRSELSKMREKYDFETAEMKSIIFEQNKEISAKSEAISTLTSALANQEQFSHNLAEKNSQLQDKIAKVEEDAAQLIAQMEEMNQANESLRKKMEQMQIEANNLVDHQRELSTLYNSQLQENCHLKENQQQMLEINSAHAAKIQEIQKTIEQLVEEKNKSSMEHEKEVSEMKKVLEKNKTDVQDKANMIATFMTDIKNGTDMRAKLEITLDKYKRDLEMYKAKEKDYLEAKKTIEECCKAKAECERQKQAEIEKHAESIKAADVEIVRLKVQIKAMQEIIVVTTDERDAAEKSVALLKSASPKKLTQVSDNHGSDHESPIVLSPVLKSQDKPAQVKEQSWVQPRRPKKMPRRTSNVPFSTPDPVPSNETYQTPESRHAARQVLPLEPDAYQSATNVSFIAPESNPVTRQPPKPETTAPPRASQNPYRNFDFSSDSSVDGYVADPRETDRRFNALMAGKRVASPLPFVPVKKHGYSHTPAKSVSIKKDQIPEKGPKSVPRIRQKGFLSAKRGFNAISERAAKPYKEDSH